MTHDDGRPAWHGTGHHANAMEAHLRAHEAKIAARRKARISADNRKKKRGLDAAIGRLKEAP